LPVLNCQGTSKKDVGMMEVPEGVQDDCNVDVTGGQFRMTLTK